MRYLFLLYADESSFPAPGSPDAQAQLAAYGAFYELVSGSGAFQAGDPVQRSSSATTVSVRDGQRATNEGPAKPGGEQIIGFYVLEVGSDAEAVELAAKIPAAAHGRVEARPILVM
ncbi:MAG TPA: YciI family protein [Solirubrobacteraceae bacterium]|nr:YciI family protein [Solirubrobacteraceae bacterium]